MPRSGEGTTPAAGEVGRATSLPEWLTVLLTFVIVVAPLVAWALVIPPYGSPDENDHVRNSVAVVSGTPIVAVFGPTVPDFGFGPRGPRDVVVERLGLDCRPCSAHGPRTCPLGHHRCMGDIHVEDVLRAIEGTGALRRRD